MPKKISLRCLLKDSTSYHIIKELKSHNGELDFNELKSELKIKEKTLISTISGLYPAVIQNGSKVSVSENYDFLVIGRRRDISFYQGKCWKYKYSRQKPKEVPLEARDLKSYEF